MQIEIARPAALSAASTIVAEALAVMLVDLVAVLPIEGRHDVLTRLANRLDGRSRVPNGSEAAHLLGGVGYALMEMGL